MKSQIFEISGKNSDIAARRGHLQTAHGLIQTPVFMPVGTKGTVKAMTPAGLKEMGASIVLGNTYHLFLRPGHELIGRAGGLHKFMGWNGPILTDSGGFQVFSLSKLRKILPEGVRFQSPIDGDTHLLTPELSIGIQETLGSDIMMAFDDCAPFPATREQISISMERTLDWEARSLAARKSDNALFAIVQGGTYQDLRVQCLERLQAISASAPRPFDGYALGGLSVGEPNEVMYEIVAAIVPHMPEGIPRYLMGVGTPEDLITCVGLGIDMFDCVMPTRNARNGMLFTRHGDINIKQAQYKEDFTPLDDKCLCYACQTFTRAYLRHLFLSDEILSSILNTIHNLHYYLGLLEDCRRALNDGTFSQFHREFFAQRKTLT
jgi:queuine tRNA-ribosyltransferase